MGFFDDITKKISMVGQEAASQTKMFAEKTRINTKIADEERQLNSIFQLIGKNYYEANKDNPNAEYKDQILTIRDAYTRIEGLKEQLRSAVGIKMCPNCGSEVAMGSMFCNACGTKMPADVPAPAPAQSNVCPQCGNEVAFGAAFCNICGSKMPEIQRPPLGSSMMPNNGSFSTPGFDTMMNSTQTTGYSEMPAVSASPAVPIVSDISNAQPMNTPVSDNPELNVPKKTISIEKKD